MRALAIACAAIVFGQGAFARDVLLTLEWPDTAPPAEIVAVARDGSGTVLEAQRLLIDAGRSETVLSLPGLSRQATSLQVGALVGDRFALQSPRVLVEGGQPPERLRLTAAMTAGFGADYLCGSGTVLTLRSGTDGLEVLDPVPRSFRPTEISGRFTAPDGRALTRIPGLLQIEGADGVLQDSCQPIPTRPILPLTAQGPQGADGPSWQVITRLEGSFLSLPGQPEHSEDTDTPPVPTTITPEPPDRLRVNTESHILRLEQSACSLPGQTMPYPMSAALTGPGGPFANGCAGDPLRGLEGPAWQVTHIFGLTLPREGDQAPAMTIQVDMGRLSGRTSCNRYLGRASVLEGALRISELGTTRLACAANLSNLETRFLDALESADDIAFLNDRLVALYAGATAVMILAR